MSEIQTIEHFEMPLKIGVMGGAGEDIPEEYLSKAKALGEAIALARCVLVTGACPGLPFASACGAKSKGGLVIGISPALSLDEHANDYESPTRHHDILVYTGSGLMGREVVNIRTSDIVTIVGGSSGTLGELAIAYDEGKLIGVLIETGGISDMVKDILSACNKDTGARVLYDVSPQSLITRLLVLYTSEHYRRPSCFCHVEKSQSSKEWVPGSERDVVCDMWVTPESSAAKRTKGSKKLVFCSLECAGVYDDNPSRFQDIE